MKLLNDIRLYAWSLMQLFRFIRANKGKPKDFYLLGRGDFIVTLQEENKVLREKLEPKSKAEESCKKCRYYNPIRQECLRHAPVVVSEGGNTRYAFPMTGDYHWCGDFEKKQG